jgi:hypothetical protein
MMLLLIMQFYKPSYTPRSKHFPLRPFFKTYCLGFPFGVRDRLSHRDTEIELTSVTD